METVGMVKRFRNWLRHITGISTPLGGVSWSNTDSWVGEVSIFQNPICITHPNNDDFIVFLEVNRGGKIVLVDSYLDASVSTKQQYDMTQTRQIDLNLITSGAFSGVPLPLPNIEDKLIDVCFHFLDDHVLTYSSGGTGIVTVPIHGFFEVTKTLHGGPSAIYHLRELTVPVEVKVAVKNRR